MPLAPLFSSACDLANQIPRFVAGFLDLEMFPGRRFREESVSDVIVASFRQLPGKDAIVIIPDEMVTGSDFDITIVDPVSKDVIRYRIQAKRLTPNANSWKIGSYRELAHPNASGHQASTLIRSAAREAITTIPLYAFYNPESACTASGGLISGIELASATMINKLVKALVKAKPKRLLLKRLEVLQPLFFPLVTIFCTGTTSPRIDTRSVISPDASRIAVESAIADRTQRTEVQETLSQALPEELVQAVGESARPLRPPRLSPLIELAIQRRNSGQIRVKTARPGVILISENG